MSNFFIGCITLLFMILLFAGPAAINDYKIKKKRIVKYGTLKFITIASTRRTNNYVNCMGCFFNDKLGCMKPKQSKLDCEFPDKIIYKKLN